MGALGTQERTDGRTDATSVPLHPSLSPPIFFSFSHRLFVARSTTLSLSLSLSRCRFSVYLLIATSPRLPWPRSAAVSPPFTRIPRFPRPRLVLQQAAASRSATRPENLVSFSIPVFLHVVLFRAQRFSSILPRSLSIVKATTLAEVRPSAASLALLPPTLDTNSLDAAEFSFEPTLRSTRRAQYHRLAFSLPFYILVLLSFLLFSPSTLSLVLLPLFSC